jgi:hypothetical protein
VISKYKGSGTPSGALVIDLSGSGVPRFGVSTGNTSVKAVASQPVSKNQYVHLAGRYDFASGAHTLFINGQPVATASAGQVAANSTRQWNIGGDPITGSASEFIDGTVDGTRIYTAALSHSQIYQIYKNTRPATRLDSLAARYTFNDGAAQDQTAGVPVSGDSTDYSGTLNGTTEAENEGVNDG